MGVLLPYRFTLFSNLHSPFLIFYAVLLPYRFTLFSNVTYRFAGERQVLLPYRFTLFSNLQKLRRKQIKFYYLIDLHYSQTNEALTYLGISFYYLIDLHYSQTIGVGWILKPCNVSPTPANRFYYLIDLHYSQTEVVATYNEFSFTTL